MCVCQDCAKCDLKITAKLSHGDRCLRGDGDNKEGSVNVLIAVRACICECVCGSASGRSVDGGITL